jgi:hypothetical protein
MPKDLDDIYKKLDQNNKSGQKDSDEIIRTVNGIEKNNDKMLKEIGEIKKEVKNIAFKVDTMLEILNNFTIMLAQADYEDDDEDEEDYDSDESWVPKEEEFWEDDNDESI